MPAVITQYGLLISCPGDVVDEIHIIEKCVQRFNDQFSRTIGIAIQSYHWSKSSYPQSGAKPQTVLNDQFIDKCDAAIAVFWTRFGTKTDEYGSGTEEEIETMLQKGKQVFLYFSEKPIVPSEINSKQYKSVQRMKEKYTSRGLYRSYSSNEEFEQLLYSHLIYYFIPLQKQNDQPKLHLQAIIAGKKIDKLVVEHFIQPGYTVSLEIEAEITDIVSMLRSYGLDRFHEPKSSVDTHSIFQGLNLAASTFEPVAVTESIKEIIQLYAKKSNIYIDESFFFLGNLQKNKLSNAIHFIGGSIYNGTDTEKKRYHDILALADKIEDFVNWQSFEETYSEFYCVSLALSNDGTTFDEDIDIELIFEKDDLIFHQELPVPDRDVLEFLDNHSSGLSAMFSIDSTPQYTSYESSQMHPRSVEAPHIAGIWPNSRDYHEEYKDTLDRIFDYAIYQNEASIILKLNMDYIKQHTSIAFPSKLFVKETLKSIIYKITSKHSPDVIEGELSVDVEKDD
jgi:hypothetical protein